MEPHCSRELQSDQNRTMPSVSWTASILLESLVTEVTADLINLPKQILDVRRYISQSADTPFSLPATECSHYLGPPAINNSTLSFASMSDSPDKEQTLSPGQKTRQYISSAGIAVRRHWSTLPTASSAEGSFTACEGSCNPFFAFLAEAVSEGKNMASCASRSSFAALATMFLIFVTGMVCGKCSKSQKDRGSGPQCDDRTQMVSPMHSASLRLQPSLSQRQPDRVSVSHCSRSLREAEIHFVSPTSHEDCGRSSGLDTAAYPGNINEECHRTSNSPSFRCDNTTTLYYFCVHNTQNSHICFTAVVILPS